MGKYDKCMDCKFYYLESIYTAKCSKKGSLIPYGCDCFKKAH